MEGRRCLLQKLDKMATIATKEENIDGINEFSDVIQFDIESHVFYFKNLLEGILPWPHQTLPTARMCKS
uniref:VLIG-type G domain-containing protein n=1 Tax=Anguilla anguilla TaxID=7936 RepID=A0A0E9T509_ANGAN